MGVPAEPCTIKQSIFTADIQGQQIHCQVVHLGKQLYVWIGTAATSSSNSLYAAVPVKHVRVFQQPAATPHPLTNQEVMPAVTVLQPGRNDEDGRAAVQRIGARRCAYPCLCFHRAGPQPTRRRVLSCWHTTWHSTPRSSRCDGHWQRTQHLGGHRWRCSNECFKRLLLCDDNHSWAWCKITRDHMRYRC